MSFSKERQDYHLTPHGWVEGSFEGDALGGTKHADVPMDRLLTVSCYDEKASPYSEPFFYDKLTWQTDDKDKIDASIKKYGDKPDWFGYKKIK